MAGTSPGELLELLHGAGGRWTTVAATVRIWRRNELEERARRRAERELLGDAFAALAPGGADAPKGELVETIRLWIAKPRRSRQEWDEAVSVTLGTTWASYHPLHGYTTNAGDAAGAGAADPLDTFGYLLDPARLLPALAFEAPAAREGGLAVRARPRPSAPRFAAFGLGQGADEHELLVDPGRGVVLRAESRLDGEPFLRSELVEPVFDEPLPDDLFALTAPPGEEVLTPSELHEHGLSVEEAAARSSFRVFVLGELPEGPWRLSASHSRARRELPERVSVLYHRSDGRGQILVTEVPASAKDGAWYGAGGRAELERDGTRVILTSEDYPVEVLRDLTGTLARA